MNLRYLVLIQFQIVLVPGTFLIENDLETMATLILDIEGLFTDSVTAIDFPMERWAG